MQRLPFAISIPHGGVSVPEEFVPFVSASLQDRIEDTDHLTREIFDVESLVEGFLAFDYGRTFVDLNRGPDDYGEARPDGVVKRLTHTNRQVFHRFPPQPLVETVLERLYRPYHETLTAWIERARFKLIIDCHSMAPKALSTSPDREGEERPLICLGHRGGASASPALVESFRACLARAYGIPLSQISVDVPFSGGYITKTYGSGTTPVIQIELNRRFYLQEQEGSATPELSAGRAQKWSAAFAEALQELNRLAFLD